MKYSTLHLTEVAFNSIKASHATPGFALTLDDNIVHLMPLNEILPDPEPEPTSGYSVTFDLNGHGVDTPSTLYNIENSGYASKPTNPSETGYTFIGWYESGSDIEWDFLNNQVTHNTVLYAHWVQQSTAQRSYIYLNSPNYSDWTWGELVSVNGNTITKIRDLSSVSPTCDYYVGIIKNNEYKHPWKRTLNGNSSSVPSNTTEIDKNEDIAYVGENYRFIAGFADTSIQMYGAKLIHTDIINGDEVTIEEIIPFNVEGFSHSWGSTFIAHDLTFTAHSTTRIITLFTQVIEDM